MDHILKQPKKKKWLCERETFTTRTFIKSARDFCDSTSQNDGEKRTWGHRDPSAGFPPPQEDERVSWASGGRAPTLHRGQMKTLMFSTTPMTGSFTLWQKLISFRTSWRDTSCQGSKDHLFQSQSLRKNVCVVAGKAGAIQWIHHHKAFSKSLSSANHVLSPILGAISPQTLKG